MSEWWTYSLQDLLMFSPQTYYRLFERYNADLWPAHLLALALGASPLILFFRDGDRARPWIVAILAAGWVAVAWFYFWTRYASIHLAAAYFALAFVVESLLLLGVGLSHGSFILARAGRWRQRTGLGIFLFALGVYPILGLALGRNWTQAEVIGLAPDPTALATLGVLLLTGPRTFWVLAPIPILWCLVSGATLWAMASPDFFIAPGLALLAALVAFSGAATAPAQQMHRGSDLHDREEQRVGCEEVDGCSPGVELVQQQAPDANGDMERARLHSERILAERDQVRE